MVICILATPQVQVCFVQMVSKSYTNGSAGTIKNEGTNHLGNVYTAGNLNMAMAKNSIEIDGNVNVAGNLTIGRANSYWDGTKMVMDIDTVQVTTKKSLSRVIWLLAVN